MAKTKVVCAWCGKTLVEGLQPTSHGICHRCERDFKRRLASPPDQRSKSKEGGAGVIVASGKLLLRKKRLLTLVAGDDGFGGLGRFGQARQ